MLRPMAEGRHDGRGGTLELEPKTLEAKTVSGKPRDTAVADTQVVVSSSDSEPRTVDPSPVSFETGGRYGLRRVLGVGGMGEVRLCTDAWVGRDVAMKVMRIGAGSQPARARFVREARVQGQLEHPSVVPVYDLGKNAAGEDFFTMKRVNGLTLEEILAGLRDDVPELAATHTRRKLLHAMSQVCLAVAYAHSRGVVHRDIKPANVMLGDFGEVYVLDWGIAKIRGVADLGADGAISGEAGSLLQTEVGALVGTPGYMSPEQARGDTDSLGPASDVYSLGAVLFELLSLQPLHRGSTVAALVASTLTQQPVAPSAWAPEAGIPPELDAICLRATALAATERFESAREMHEAIERYLDGERDAERRRELAKSHLDRARDALGMAAQGGVEAAKHRDEGMRELSRALALDPTDAAALRLITDLVLRGSDELPPEAEIELKAVELRDRTVAARRNVRSLLAWLTAVPVMAWMGVKSTVAAGLFAAAWILVFGITAWIAKTGRSEPRYMRVALVANFTLVMAVSTLFGPFVFAPAMAAIMASAFVVGIRANATTRRAVAFLSFTAVFLPAGAQWLGWIPASYAFEDGVIKILPVMLGFAPEPAAVMLVGATAVQLLLSAILVGQATDALVGAERRNFSRAWRLRQLVPAAGLSEPPPALDAAACMLR